jgi:hypothetical protein
MRLLIPLEPTPAQTLTIALAGQNVRLIVSQKAFGLFVDVFVNDALVIGGVLARNLARIVRGKYLGFVGDIYFYDTQGMSDPAYAGLGSRYTLLYDDAA